MVYAILLDDDQESGGDQYAVRFSGSLAACRGQSDYDADVQSWPRREYQEVSTEPKSLRDGLGTTHSGRIAGLRAMAGSFARATAAAPSGSSERRRPAALVLLGMAIGGALAYHRTRRSRPRDRK